MRLRGPAIGLLLAAILVLPSGTRADALRGRLTSIGSDTLAGVMTRWGEAFRERHPDVLIQIQTPGSGSAPQALIEGSAILGPMSRPMSAAEVAAFRARHGHDPSRVAVASDAVAVIVHAKAPLGQISLDQLDAVFSVTRYCAARKQVRHWNDLAPDSGNVRPLLRVGRNSASGTHEYFRQRALCGGDFRADLLQLPGAGAVVQLVAGDERAIGFVGAGVANASVRTLALAGSDGVAIRPTPASIRDGRYPLARPLFLYFNRTPGSALPPLLHAWFDYVLSAEGQRVTEAEGLVRLGQREIEVERERLGLGSD